MGRHPRLSWLAACALLFACGGDPAPKQVEQPRSGFKSKKKKHKSEDAEASKESEKPRSKEDKEAELEREAEKERQERKERQRKRDQEAAEEEKQVAATDEGGSSDAESDPGEKSEDDADAKKAADEKKAEQEEAKAKKKAAREEALAKKKAAREEALAKKKAAAEEAKAKKLAAAEAKKNKKKKGKEDAEEASSDEAAAEGEATKTDEETAAAEEKEKATADEETPKAKRKGAKESKAKKKVAKADDEEKASDEEEPKSEPKAKARKGKTKEKAKEKEKDKDADEDSEKEAAKEPKSDEESIDMEETTTASVKDPSHDSDELDLTSTPKETKEEETAPPVPMEIDRRPLTAAKGKLEVHGGLRVGVLTLPNGMGGSVSSTSEGLALGATYGLGGKAEVGFDYTVGLHPGSAKGPLLFHGAYRVAQSEKFDMALAVGFAADFISVTDPATMMTTSQTATALQLGGWARYHVGRTLSVFTGLPALPSSSGSLSGSAAPLPPLPYQLTIGLSSKGAIALDIPVGAGYQATPKIYAFASLDLARLGMSNADSAFVFADFIPLALGGFYTSNKIDIGAVLGDDLKQGVDYLRFDVVARYSLK